jgi:hypothetical protein
LAWLHRPGHSLAVEAAGTEVADSTGKEAAFTQVAAAFTVADLAFAEADFAGAGSAFSAHTPTVAIPTYYGDDYEGGCYLVARRVLTRYGWRSRRVEICD